MKHPLLLSVLVLCALAVLLSLGTWQVQRLAWKEQLLARIAATIDAPAQPYRRLTESLDPRSDGDGALVRVTATGTFDHTGETHVYGMRGGQPGYRIFTPLMLKGEGYRVFVNRGFVAGPPGDARHLDFERPAGVVTVSGITRNPDLPGPFDPVPDNARGIRYVADLSGMHADCATAAFDCQFYIEADRSNDGPGRPQGRDPRDLLASIPNNHLGYAITWYGLALALAAVYGFFLYGGSRKSEEGEQ